MSKVMNTSARAKLRSIHVLTDGTELDRYHQAIGREAAQLSVSGRTVVAGFLSAVTAHAADATAELQPRKARRASG